MSDQATTRNDELAGESDSQEPPTSKDGGIKAWLTVFGAWLVMFATFGYLYSFGVYQDFYTRLFLSTSTPSKIGWIGSFQLMMPFVCGIISGKLFDSGYFHALEIFGSSVFVVSLFMLSLAKPRRYFEVFLSQGLGLGIGLGCTFIPTVTIVVHHFSRRKVLATGVVMSGSSLGAVIFPITSLVSGNALMRTAYDNNRISKIKPDVKSFFREPAYLLICFGTLVAFFGLYFPLLYLQLYAVEHGINKTIAFYSLAALNGASTFGRVFGNYTAERLGPANMVPIFTLITGATIFAVLAIQGPASLMVVSIVHGLFSGAWLSIAISALSTLARHPNEVGARLGIALAFSSFGSLGASPVQGALLTSEFKWNRPIIFSGALMTVSSFIYWIARTILAKDRSTWKV